MEILIIIGLILLNGLFAMSEIAIISARKSSLSLSAKQGSRAAQTALRLAEQPDHFLSTVQIGITLIGILTGIYSGDVLAGSLSVVLVGWGIPYAYAVAQITIVVVVTYFSIIIGELIPKRIGLMIAERVATWIARPMYWLSVVAAPLVWVLSKSTSVIVKMLRINDRSSVVTEQEIKALIDEGHLDGVVQEVERDIVERVFLLGDRRVSSIMTHRSDIVWLSLAMTPSQIYRIIAANPHDTYPITEKSLDRIVGVVRLKNLFGKLDIPTFHLCDVMEPVHHFHESMAAYQALEQLKTRHLSYAVVCDEFGETQGLVTLRDILEALVGELPEAHEQFSITPRPDGGWLVDGQCSFHDFLSYFDAEDLLCDKRYNTVAGLVIAEVEHIPVEGEKTTWKGFTFEVVDMDGVRIDKLLVTHH